MRPDNRTNDQLRPVRIETGVNLHAEGSALIHFGDTSVLCLATVEDRVPSHRKGTGSGWVTAEYAMLPRATVSRAARESVVGRLGGRTHEIQRLIGRSLRAAVDLGMLGERTVIVDCDVLQADGGTRTAAISGGFVALYLALRKLHQSGELKQLPVRCHVGAVSAGMVEGEPRLDLNYQEDYLADTDLNCVMTDSGHFVEVQATAEGQAFTPAQLESMLELASVGVKQIIEAQKHVLSQSS